MRPSSSLVPYGPILNAVKVLLSVLPAGFLSACAPTAEEPLPVVGPEAFDSEFPAGFVADAHCTPLSAYTPPEVGADYVFRDDDGRRSSRRIVSVEGARIGMQYQDLSTPGQGPLPPGDDRRPVRGRRTGRNPAKNLPRRSHDHARDPSGRPIDGHRRQ